MNRLVNPALAWERLSRPVIGANLLALFTPVAFLPLLSWWIVGIIPALLPHWLSSSPLAVSLAYHNHVLAIPFIWLAAMAGAKRLSGQPRSELVMLIIFCLTTLWSVWANSELPGSRYPHIAWGLRDSAGQEFRQLAHTIPTRHSVAYSYGLDPFFRNHEFSYVLPSGMQTAAYVAVAVPPLIPKVSNHPVARKREPIQHLFDYLKQSAAWTTVTEYPQAGIFRRDFSRALEPLPVDFNNTGVVFRRPK